MNCVADSISNVFKEDHSVNEELCLKEKEEFYNYLHEINRLEHDNLMRFYTNVLTKTNI
jgi:hypothetical protein